MKLLSRMKSGFILPLALVSTVIVLTIVAASARYCTTAMAVSQEYLARTRCRLAAQSALEIAKTKLMEQCAGMALPIPDAANVNYGADISEVIQKLKDPEVIQKIKEAVPDFNGNIDIYLDIQRDPTTGLNRLIATAEIKQGRNTSTITMQECFKIPVKPANIYSYVYLSNGDGHLLSKYTTVNGDVRCNGDFYLTGAEVNGFIIASNKVHLATSGVSWFDGNNVTIRTNKSYDDTYRTNNYAKVRPTNPLNNEEWPAGFDGATSGDAKTKTRGIIGAIFNWIVNPGDADTAVVTTNLTSSYSGEKVVHENAGKITIPRIISGSDTLNESEGRFDLASYRRYAENAKTPKGAYGGSLICSNCFRDASGNIQQLSAKLRLNATRVDLYHQDEIPAEVVRSSDDNYTRVGEFGGRGSTSTGLVPPNSIPVYEYKAMTETEYKLGAYDVSLFHGVTENESFEWTSVGAYPGFVKSTSRDTGYLIMDDPTFQQVSGKYANDVRDELTNAVQNVGIGGYLRVNNLEKDVAYKDLGLINNYYYRSKIPIGYIQVFADEEGVQISYHWIDKKVLPDDEQTKIVNTGYNQYQGRDIIWQGVREEDWAHYSSTLTYREKKKWQQLTPTEYENYKADKLGIFWKTVRINGEDILFYVAESDLADNSYKELLRINDRNNVGNSRKLWNERYKLSASNAFVNAGWTYQYPRPRHWYRSIAFGEIYNTYKYEYKNWKDTFTFIINSEKLTVSQNETFYNAEFLQDRTDSWIAQNYIPVYEYKPISSVTSSEKRMYLYYTVDANCYGYLNTTENHYVEKDAVTKVAQQLVSQYGRTHNDNGLTEKDIYDLFGDKDNWVNINEKNNIGSLSVECIGYYEIKLKEITLGSTKHIECNFIPKDEITETIEKRKDVHDTLNMSPARDWAVTSTVPYTVTRELRRIFVNWGWQTKDSNLWTTGNGKTDPDLILTRNDDDTVKDGMNATGGTVSQLRPFREDKGESSLTLSEEDRPKDAGYISSSIIPYHCNAHTTADKGSVILIGTWDFPIIIDGPVVFDSDVWIRGFVSGRGTIYAGRNIHIIGDINYKNPPYWPKKDGKPETQGKDLLTLVSRGSIVVGNYVMDKMWTGTDGVLKGHLIDGHEVTIDQGHNWLGFRKKGSTEKYTEFDYTQNDLRFASKKVKFTNTNGSNGSLSEEPVKFYESVIGDWAMVSKDTTYANCVVPDKKAVESAPYCDCRFSSYWDCNPYNLSLYDSKTSGKTDWAASYACYQSGLIEKYFQNQNLSVEQRKGTGVYYQFSFNYLFNKFNSFCLNNYAAMSTREHAANLVSTALPRADYIHEINAVLCSSMGLYGVVGGHNTPFVLNGSLIAQDEALIHFARHRYAVFFNRESPVRITLNWDIRLNSQSGDSRFNNETDYETLRGFKDETASEATTGAGEDPRIFFWQEVPDSFNDEYNNRNTPSN